MKNLKLVWNAAKIGLIKFHLIKLGQISATSKVFRIQSTMTWALIAWEYAFLEGICWKAFSAFISSKIFCKPEAFIRYPMAAKKLILVWKCPNSKTFLKDFLLIQPLLYSILSSKVVVWMSELVWSCISHTGHSWNDCLYKALLCSVRFKAFLLIFLADFLYFFPKKSSSMFYNFI